MGAKRNGLPPSEIHRMTGLPPKIVWTMTYSHRTHREPACLFLASKMLPFKNFPGLRPQPPRPPPAKHIHSRLATPLCQCPIYLPRVLSAACIAEGAAKKTIAQWCSGGSGKIVWTNTKYRLLLTVFWCFSVLFFFYVSKTECIGNAMSLLLNTLHPWVHQLC